MTRRGLLGSIAAIMAVLCACIWLVAAKHHPAAPQPVVPTIHATITPKAVKPTPKLRSPSPTKATASAKPPIAVPAAMEKAAASFLDHRENTRPGSTLDTLRQHHWQIGTSDQCSFDTEAAAPTSSTPVLECALTDYTLDSKLEQVPTIQLPQYWVFNGRQEPAYLVMERIHGKWAVYADKTGLVQ